MSVAGEKLRFESAGNHLGSKVKQRKLARARRFLERACTSDTDPAEERRRKVTSTVLTGICFVASIVWGTLYYAILGPTITVSITYAFTVVIGAALLVFLVTKRFALLLYPFFF